MNNFYSLEEINLRAVSLLRYQHSEASWVLGDNDAFVFDGLALHRFIKCSLLVGVLEVYTSNLDFAKNSAQSERRLLY